MAFPEDLARRLDRLESLDEIRQLAAKYALALDMRDADAWAGLFPQDIRVGRGAVGRAALRDWFDETMRGTFTGTAHQIGNHIIEFRSPDEADGLVYSRNEHETGDQWIVMQMMYFDRYERIDDRWFFRRRLPLYWYAADMRTPPTGELKMRWPGQETYDGGFHKLFPSWDRFWSQAGPAVGPVADPAPLEQFLSRMRGETPLPGVRVR